MKGQEISRRFFEEWGLPYIREHFPQIEHRVAAGLFHKSQSIGADDELSRDHDWGAGFELILTDVDFNEMGETVRQKINTDVPKEWQGWPMIFGEGIPVESVSGFFKRETSSEYESPPEDWEFGEAIESHLFFIKNGPLYYDPLGDFTARRDTFCKWPEAFLKKKMRRCCWLMWHHGRYNFVTRVCRRNDPVAVYTCLGEFLNATMRLCLYLNDEFAPYWKWIPYQFRKIGWATDIIDHVDALALSYDKEEQAQHVAEICNLVEAKLERENLQMRVEA